MKAIVLFAALAFALPAHAAPKKAKRPAKVVQMAGRASGAASAPQIVPLSGKATASGGAH